MEIRGWGDESSLKMMPELPLWTTVQGGLGFAWLVEESMPPDVTCSSAQQAPAFWEQAEAQASPELHWRLENPTAVSKCVSIKCSHA